MIRKIIERHPYTAHLNPNNPEQWAAGSFTVERQLVSRDPSVLAAGLYSNITGARADVIICDDVEVPNTCDTADKREKLRDRLGENEFILVPGGRQLYIGTPHTYYTIYADAPRTEIRESDIFLKEFEREYIPILEEDGSSAWPERYSVEHIESMRKASGPLKFASQMMLKPASIHESRLNVGLLRRYDDELVFQEIQKSAVLSIDGLKILSASAWWDPAFGQAKGDASVLAVVYTDENGDHRIHRMEYIKVKAGAGEDEASLQCRKVCEVIRELYLPSIAVETNGLGKFLPAILRREIAEARLPCTVIEKNTTKSKDTRILEAFDAAMAARSVYVHESVYSTRFITEMQEWRPGLAGARDDGLDAAAGALSLEPVRIRKSYSPASKLWSGSGSGHMARTEFEI